MNIKKFRNIEKKYGSKASWAVWERVGDTSASNMDDMSMFENKRIADTLLLLKTDIVMVGLNKSKEVNNDKSFRNFHSKTGNDYKIRYTFEGTSFYGAYMTDVLDIIELKAEDVKKYLKEHPSEEKKHVNMFLEELDAIGANSPTIIAFGQVAYSILKRNLKSSDYSELIRVTHYSAQGDQGVLNNKDKYRDKVLHELSRL